MPRTERAIRDRCGATLALLLALCAGATPARAQAPAHRVADLQTAPASNLAWPDPTSSDPSGFAHLGAQALFWARTPQSGIELWSTDGSEAGTRFVKEVAFPGSIGPRMTFYPSAYSVPGLPPPMLGGALTFGLEQDPLGALARMVGLVERTGRTHGVEQSLWMTIGLSDGESIWAVRYASDGDAPTLYHSRDVDDLVGLNPQIATTLGADARVVVSEPIGRFAEIWAEVPQGSALHARAGKIEIRAFEPTH